jgi:hypothetical protein
MNKMNQIEYATVEVPASARRAKPSHLEDLSDQIGPVSKRLTSGEAFLKVVAYPWGVEFDVCDGEGEK